MSITENNASSSTSSVADINATSSESSSLSSPSSTGSAAGIEAAAEPAITFDHVSYRYSDEDGNVVDDLTLSIARGEYVAIVGSNGSGKSTVAKLMNGIYQPDEGVVRVMGRDTSDESQRFYVRQHAGLVFQDPDDQMITSVVADDVAFGPENLGMEPAEIARRVETSLTAVAMQDFSSRETDNLSGGQKQRVAIAGILAMTPDVLILDEPGAMLDVRGRRGIRRVSHELNAQGITVVLITHFMDEAISADRVIVLDRGRIVTQGSTTEVFTHHELMSRLRLEEPFSVQLTAALRRRGTYAPFTVDEDLLQDALCR